MKTIIYALFTFIITGCIEELTGGGHPHLEYIFVKNSDGDNLSGYTTYLNALGGDLAFSIVSSYSDINVNIGETWLSCKNMDDSHYIISAEYNNHSYERKGTIEVRNSNEVCKTFNICQYGRKLTLSGGSEIRLSAEGGSSGVYEIKADGGYSISKGEDDSWYTLTRENNSFYVTVAANNTTYSRQGKITVALTGLPDGELVQKEVIVTQSASS